MHVGDLNLHTKFNAQTTKTYAIPKLTNGSLLSVGQFCDQDCKVIFEKTKYSVEHNNQMLLTGPRNFNDDLWDIPLLPKNTHTQDR